ncbi:S-layer homology domain-containing protein [Feifania hominis]|uniref:S-layer homology domain-containing protein n=1 Tax=Feifania hominis TaxID=2763660 RepID=A0A926DE38_9FIRM|nr:S-layer homology domain-containing protein [Feifania hominis]MBC8535634.1 S-layer homology domain-containing protein [Feifania hominis]
MFTRKLWCRFVALLCVLLMTISLSAVASYQLTDGNSVITDNMIVYKNALYNTAVQWSADDFSIEYGTMDGDDVASVVITELPKIEHGTLKLGEKDVVVFQTIKKSNLGRLKFVPAKDFEGVTYFVYRASDGENLSAPVKVCINFSATVNKAPETKDVKTSTQKNLKITGRMSASDPDNDEMIFTVTKEPKKGELYYNSFSSSYEYIPHENATGTDSFTYEAKDVFGNVSEPAKVTIKINKPSSELEYEDMAGSYAHYAAIKLAEKDIIRGETLAGSNFFYPDEEVSRGDFLVMLMKASDSEFDMKTSATVSLADEEQMSPFVKPYVKAAFASGIVSGTAGDVKTFCAQDTVTRAEAAVMINNILQLPDDTVFTPTFADADTIPTWATAAVSNLGQLNILNGYEDETIGADRPMTRAEAAQVIWQMMEYQSNTKDSGGFLSGILWF